MSNLSGELFKQLTGLNDLVHIPYKGAGPGITDLVSGHIPMMSPNVTAQILELHRAGKIRILAVNAAERLSAAPDIPTAIEEGVPGMIGLLFLGLFAPAATPKPIVDRIAAASRAAMADAEFQSADRPGPEAIPDPIRRKLFMDEEIARWAPVVRPRIQGNSRRHVPGRVPRRPAPGAVVGLGAVGRPRRPRHAPARRFG
jgi:tripartite-type tricarboxylate transporter receptor subunit TctC